MDEIYDSVDPTEPTIDFVSIASELVISLNETSNKSIEAAIVGNVRHLNPGVQALLTVFYLLGISGNVGALILLGRNETARNKRQTLMLKCLAWNDLLAVSGSAIQMHMQLYLPSQWVLTRYFCGVRVFWRAFGLGSGCVSLTMAVERWIALTKPFLYQTQVTYRRIQCAIFGLWIAVTVLCCLPFAGFGLYYDTTQIGWRRCSRYRFGTTPDDIAYAYMWLSFGLIMCVLIVACNLGVIKALFQMNRRSETRRLTRPPAQLTGQRSHSPFKSSSHFRNSIDMDDATSYTNYNSSLSRNTLTNSRQRDSSAGSSSSRHRHHHHHHQPCQQTQEEMKFARLMAVLCIFYVLCWIPQLVAIPVGLANPKNQERVFFRVADVCIALNFVLDPFIYVLLRSKCGRAFWFRTCNLFMCCRKSSQQEMPHDPQLTKIDGKLAEGGLENGIQTQAANGSDRDYVPLKTLLVENRVGTSNADNAKEHPV